MKLLENFGHMSLRRFITFFSELFSVEDSGRRLKRSTEQSPTIMRADHRSHFRELQCGAPLFMIDLNQYISLYFDFNFGGGQKDLLFGILLNFYSGEALTDS